MATILLIKEEASAGGDHILRTLFNEGHEVATVSRVSDGIIILDQLGFDLIVAEFLLRDGNILELLTLLRRSRIFVPVIALASNAETRDVIKMASFLGARATITEPLANRRLLEAVEHVLISRISCSSISFSKVFSMR